MAFLKTKYVLIMDKSCNKLSVCEVPKFCENHWVRMLEGKHNLLKSILQGLSLTTFWVIDKYYVIIVRKAPETSVLWLQVLLDIIWTYHQLA